MPAACAITAWRRWCRLVKELGLIEAPRLPRRSSASRPALQFARSEGIIPAPEANHAVAARSTRRLRCKREGRRATILFNLCGHGHFDMQAYIDYFGRQAERQSV